MAAGLAEVWSTIRLLMTRGSESMTDPLVCAYDVGPGGPTAKRGGDRLGVAVDRGGQARERLVRGTERLLARHEVVAGAIDGTETERQRRVRDLVGAVARAARRRARSPMCVLTTWASAMLICSRMYDRSAAETVKPCPTGAACTAPPTEVTTRPPSRETIATLAATRVRRLARSEPM